MAAPVIAIHLEGALPTYDASILETNQQMYSTDTVMKLRLNI